MQLVVWLGGTHLSTATIPPEANDEMTRLTLPLLAAFFAAPAMAATDRIDDFDAGQYDTHEAPGFEVDVQNCDGTETLVDLLPLPRPLSHRYADNAITVAMPLENGRPADIELVVGDEQLLSALRFPLERSRYAAVEPNCILMRVRVTQTTLKAEDTVNFRTWVDVETDAEGMIQHAKVVGETPDNGGRMLLEEMARWQLETGGAAVETSLMVSASLLPNADGGYDLAAVPEYAGPRPKRQWEPRRPQRMLDLGHYFGGHVTMEFDVDAKGKPRNIRVVESEPPGAFDSPAVAALKRWRYTVVKSDGEPVPVAAVRQSIVFDALDKRYEDIDSTCDRMPDRRNCMPTLVRQDRLGGIGIRSDPGRMRP